MCSVAHLWRVPKGEEGPAIQALLGKKLRRALSIRILLTLGVIVAVATRAVA